MYQRNNRKLIARTIALTLGLFAATLYAERGRRVAIDSSPFNWTDDIVVDFDSDANGGNHRTPDMDPADPDKNVPADVPVPIHLPTDMKLEIGDPPQPFNVVWINANGFISLGYENSVTHQVTGTPEEFKAPGPTSFDGVAGNIVAPFYADTTTNAPSFPCYDQDHAKQEDNCDVTYALLPPENIGSADPDKPPPLYDRGIRVTWGFGAANDELRGLTENGGDTSLRNRFQVKLLALGANAGDFDIEFNYDAIDWEKTKAPPSQQQVLPRTLIGLKAGGKLLDFSKFFDSFVFDSSLPSPASCDGTDDTEAPPTFARTTPFFCNRVTIQVRNGIPKLATYTADVSAQLLAGGAGPLYTTEAFPLSLKITNGNDQQATNVKATVQLPNATTIVSSPGATCTANGSSADCTFGSIDAGRTESFTLNLRSTLGGPRVYEATISADQYDFDELNNKSSTPSLDLAVATADLVTTCAAPASVTQGNPVTVQCSVTNNGPRNATGVVAQTSNLPSILTFASGSGCSLSGTHVTCSPGTLTSGATTTFSMTLNAVSAGTASVSATIDADQDDPVAGNDSASASITVSAATPPPVIPPTTPKKGGGSLSLWLLMSLALLASRRRFQIQSY